jgi:hypothetical protein
MSLRESVSDPQTSPDTTCCGGMSDYQAVDSTPGLFMSLVYFVMKIWWLVFIIFGLAALSFPYLFPDWAQKYKAPLREMGIAANTGKFLENTGKVDWSEAFSSENLKNLFLVGTGSHAQFKRDKNLSKENFWYTGDVFIMKRYVTDFEYIRHKDNIFKVDGEMVFPASEVDHDEASEYCHAQGGRLPSHLELAKAYHFATTKAWQGKTGNLIKPNLTLDIHQEYSLWTATPQSDGFFEGDNFLVFTPKIDEFYYEDNGYSSESLSFLCVVDEIK